MLENPTGNLLERGTTTIATHIDSHARRRRMDIIQSIYPTIGLCTVDCDDGTVRNCRVEEERALPQSYSQRINTDFNSSGNG